MSRGVFCNVSNEPKIDRFSTVLRIWPEVVLRRTFNQANPRLFRYHNEETCWLAASLAPGSRFLSLTSGGPESKPRMCSVLGCASWRRGAKRFNLPEDPERRLAWVEFIFEVNGQRLKESSWTDITICSEHFTEECFENPTVTEQLKARAVPSLCVKPDPGEPTRWAVSLLSATAK